MACVDRALDAQVPTGAGRQSHRGDSRWRWRRSLPSVSPPAPGVAAKQPLDLESLQRYRRGFGADYWSFSAGDWLVLGRSFSGPTPRLRPSSGIGSRRSSPVRPQRPLALLVHKPLFLDDPAAPTPPHIRYVPVLPRLRLLSLLARLELRLVLSGHTHQHLDRVVGGVRHVWLPSTAFTIPDSKQDRVGEKLTGVGMLELSEQGHRFDLVVPDGMERRSLLDPRLAPLIAAR
jgi:hypothetical protein